MPLEGTQGACHVGTTRVVDPAILAAGEGVTVTTWTLEDTLPASLLTATDASGNLIPLTASVNGVLPLRFIPR